MRQASREGLRAAAKIAFSVAAIGCRASAPSNDTPLEIGRPIQQPPTEPAQATVRPPVSCAELIAATFPDPGTFPGTRIDAEPELLRCCYEHIMSPEGDGPYRWACCAQLEPYPLPELGSSCTPWGPPTPPAMRRSASRPDVVTDRDPARRAPTALDLRVLSRAIGLAVEASGEARSAAIATWHARMINEHASARVFEALAVQLEAAGLVDEAASASGFAIEERAHGARCGAVVEALGGLARGAAPAPEPFPLHPDAATPREAALRNVVAVSCLSETVAVALIGAERAAMPDGPLRDLLTSIWADEIGHARLGWRLLDRVAPSLRADERDGLERYLGVAIDHLIEHQHAHLPAGFEPPAGGESLGLCSGREARRLFAATLERVVIPALAQRGLAPRSRGPRSPRRPLPRARGRAPSRREGSGRRRASSTTPTAG